MAQFNWGQALKAPLPFDGQPFVDDARHVWQWNTATQSWNRADYLELRRVREYVSLCAGSLIVWGPFGVPRAGSLGSEWIPWNDVYDLSFVEVWSMAGTLLGRRAHMDLAALNAWFGTVVPNDGTRFTESAILHIYEVVDTRQRLARWNTWNGLYGSFRGRDCYHGERGYGRYWPAQGYRGGYSDSFRTYHGGVDLEQELFNYFYGFYPGSSSARACWSSGKRTVSRAPNMALGPVMNVPWLGAGGRTCWDWGTSDWGDAPAGDWEVFVDPPFMIRQNPCHVYRQTDSGVLVLMEPRVSMRGLGALVAPGSGPIEGMLAIALRNVADHNFVAFLLKPIGITKCAFVASGDSDSPPNDVIAVGVYDGRAGDKRYMNITTKGWVENRGSPDGFRIQNLPRLVDALNLARAGGRTSMSVDSNQLPSEVRFYLRHNQTGIRSEELSTHIRVERRKNGMPVSLVDVR